MKRIQATSSLFIIFFINFIFLAKYTARFTHNSLLLSLALSIPYCLIYFYLDSFKITISKLNKLLLGAVPLYVLGAVLLFHFYPLSNVNVDRYSVITSFWDNFFHSKYVYFAKSHQGNMPGPMPFYFIMALPFYFLGDLGYFSITGLIVFVVVLKYGNIAASRIISGILLVLGSAFMFWEIVSRSNIFLNSSLILLSILIFIKTTGIKRQYHILLNGIIIGLLISTRNVLTIPYIVLFLHILKNKVYSFKDMIRLSFLIVFIFILTFVPFVMYHYHDFLRMNPFIIQSSFLMPSWMSFSCIALTLSALFLTKSYIDVIYYSGLYLFITILIYMIYHIFKEGLYNALYNSTIDISYFILCIPFFILSLLFAKKTSVNALNVNPQNSIE